VCLGSVPCTFGLTEPKSTRLLCYFLLDAPQQGKLMAGETGATAKHVNMKDIRVLELSGLPGLKIQHAIVLSWLPTTT